MARNVLLSISCEAGDVLVLLEAACHFCLVLVICYDLSLAGNVHEVMAVISQTRPLREGRQALVAS